jgi:hypothetical protein
MRNKILMATALAGALALPFAANAQDGAGTAAGATAGAVGGAIVGGPVGAVVGGIGGAIVGGISDTNAQRFRTYAVREARDDYRYEGKVVVGTELPPAVVYYDVPQEYGVREYRYTRVNGRVVLVDPRTRRIVQIVD